MKNDSRVVVSVRLFTFTFHVFKLEATKVRYPFASLSLLSLMRRRDLRSTNDTPAIVTPYGHEARRICEVAVKVAL